MILRRPPKLTHTQTILYEIDMLRFTHSRARSGNGFEEWRNLECFLLHFRNLIEFFGNPNSRSDTLSVQEPPEEFTRDPEKRTQMKNLFLESLWRKYEVRDVEAGEENDKISRYLQHCTQQRVRDKVWHVQEMFEELQPFMVKFEELIDDKHRSWGRSFPAQEVTLLLGDSCSTASGTKRLNSKE
jgi:hypothetical protein